MRWAPILRALPTMPWTESCLPHKALLQIESSFAVKKTQNIQWNTDRCWHTQHMFCIEIAKSLQHIIVLADHTLTVRGSGVEAGFAEPISARHLMDFCHIKWSILFISYVCYVNVHWQCPLATNIHVLIVFQWVAYKREFICEHESVYKEYCYVNHV